MNQIQFSVPQKAPLIFKSGTATCITNPGYAEYWLVDEGLAVIPTSDETQEFWKSHVAKIRNLQASGDAKTLEELNTELETTKHCLGFWVEHFLEKYFFARTCLDIKRGIASEGEKERHFAFIKHGKTHQIWHQELGYLSEDELEEEIDSAADDHHALNAMLTELRQICSPVAHLSHQWMWSRDFLSGAHLPEFFTKTWGSLYSVYETEFQHATNSTISAEKQRRTQELEAALQRFVVELSEIREIAEEHWHTAIQVWNLKCSKKGDLESLSEYLEEELFLKYKDMGLEELCTLKEKYELSISAMNTMLSEAVSLSQSLRAVPA